MRPRPLLRRLLVRPRPVVAIAIGCALAAAAGCGEPAADAGPRHLVVIGIDTVRYDAFWLPETAGRPDALSPWLERGLRFRRALAPAPWTLPTVASLFTGLYPIAHGAGSYRGGGRGLSKDLPPPLDDRFETLPERLRREGYRTAGFVAQAFFHDRMGLTAGFDVLRRGERREALVRRAFAWLDGVRAEDPVTPFLLYVHLLEAHREHMAGEEAVRRAAAAMPPERRRMAAAAAPAGICAEDDRGCRAWVVYVDAVLGLRSSIADVLAGLEARGLLDDTVVWIYSDHGEEFFDHRAEQVARGTNPRKVAGFGHGHAMYQELLHVPLVAWHPRLAGRDVELAVSLVDVRPTTLDWLGLERAAVGDGVSLAGRLAGGDDGEPDANDRRVLYASGMAEGPPETVAVRGRLKRIRRLSPEERVAYDLRADPREERPLEPPPADAAALDRAIEAYDARGSDAGPPPTASPEVVDALQALGYLEEREAE